MTQGTPSTSRVRARSRAFAPDLLQSTEHHLCSGCGHPVAWRLLVEVLDELELVDRSIGVVGHGCYTQIITTADVEFLQCLHGRAPAVATGMKRMLPDRAIYTLQGDGDMVSEGLAEVLHAAARGESITCLMLDNGVFGDTGGQMTATTTVGQRTKTEPRRSRAERSTATRSRSPTSWRTFPGVAYVARGAVDKPNAVARTRRYLREAFESQLAGEGFSLVEILTMCPTGWAVPTDQGARVPARPDGTHLPARRAAPAIAAPTLMDVRIHDLLARAARVSPDRSRRDARRRRRARSRELDAGANRAAHRLRGRRRRRRSTGSCGGARPRSTRSSSATASASSGATLAPINPNFTEPEAIAALETLQPARSSSCIPTLEDVARAVADPLGRPGASSPAPAGTTARRPPRRRASATQRGPEQRLPHQRVDRRVEGRDALAPRRPGCARIAARRRGRRDRAARRRGDVRPVPHGRLVLHRERVGGDRPVHLVHRADPHELLGAVERWRASALYCIPAVWQRILDDGGTYDTSSLVEVLTGTSLVTSTSIDAMKARFPGSWTSVAYGSTEIGRGAVLARPRSLRPSRAASGNRRRWSSPTLADDGELLAARPHDVLRLPRPARRHRRGDRRRRLVPHRRPRHPRRRRLPHASPAGARSRSARAASGWRRSRWRARSAPTRRSPRSRWSGSPTPSWGELVCAAIVVRPGATLPTVDELRAHVAGVLVGPKQPRVVVQVDALPRTDATGQIRRRRLRDTIVSR